MSLGKALLFVAVGGGVLDKYFRFRLTAPEGIVIAVSSPFPDKAAAVAGITAVREYAGMGLITDLCPDIPLHRPLATIPSAARTTFPVSTAVPPAGARSADVLPPWTATGAPARPGVIFRSRLHGCPKASAFRP
ncbi:YegP family protein [Arthrobacter sp. U41]|uniref:YegP family protein n=1 Tax=Arthrobacter sp. U41 TaxID=1849032 RepID=UPI0009F3B7D2|nr:YegP family protein [Arthrobacter sp. U41]